MDAGIGDGGYEEFFQPMQQSCPQRTGRSGFTTAELLVGALVVLILFIAASPFYRAAREEASRQRCMAARRLIADAQEKYRAQSPTHSYADDVSELAAFLPILPRCPNGGRFLFRIADDRGWMETAGATGRRRLVILCSEDGHKPYFAPPPQY
jgi:type II secretory pathway pseudopilin PulG